MEDFSSVSKRLVGGDVNLSPYEARNQVFSFVDGIFRSHGIPLDNVAIDSCKGGYQVTVVLPEDVSIVDNELCFHGIEKSVSVSSLVRGLSNVSSVRRLVLNDRLGKQVVCDVDGGSQIMGESFRGNFEGTGSDFVNEEEVKDVVDRLFGLKEQALNITYAEAVVLKRASEGLPLRRNREVARLVARGFLRPEGGVFVITDLGKRALEMMPKVSAGPQWGSPPGSE